MLQDNIWNGDRAPSVKSGILELVTPSQWKALVPTGQWSSLKIVYDGFGNVDVLVNNTVIASSAATPNVTRTNDWTLILGNFDGDLDDVEVRSASPGLALDTEVANLVNEGLTAEYYEGSNFEQLRLSRIDSQINFDWASDSPSPLISPDGFSARWRGCLIPNYTEAYTLHATADDGVKVWVDDTLVVDAWGASGGEHSGTVSLKANVPAMILIEYVEHTGNASMTLEWSSASQNREVIPATSFQLNETRAQGTILSTYPGSWAEWIASARSNGSDLTSPHSNNDGDYLVDLLEYALGESPGTGVPAHLSGGLELLTRGPDDEHIEAVFCRPSSIGDLTYALEVSADGVDWQELPSSGPNADITVTRHSHGMETVCYHNIDTQVAGITERGFARLRVDLDGSLFSAVTQQCAWYRTTLQKGHQTMGISVIKPAILSGRISVSSGETFEFDGGGDLTGLFNQDSSYYLEIRSGDYEGHRIGIDLDRTTAGRIALAPGAPGNTLAELPAGTAGDVFAIRPHFTIGESLPKSRLSGGLNPASTDQLLIYKGEARGYETFFLLDAGNLNYWTAMANATLSDTSSLPILPGQGFFLKRASNDPVTLTATGLVRLNDFAQPLSQGYNLVAEPYPQSCSPTERNLGFNHGFTGSNDPTSADQIQLWNPDHDAESDGYTGFFLLDVPNTSFRYWTDLANASLTDRDNATLFHYNRATFIRINGPAQLDYLVSPRE